MFNKELKAQNEALLFANTTHSKTIGHLRDELRALSQENDSLKRTLDVIASRVEGLDTQDLNSVCGKRWISQESGNNPREVDELRRQMYQQRQELQAVSAENAALRKAFVPHAVAERVQPIAQAPAFESNNAVGLAQTYALQAKGYAVEAQVAVERARAMLADIAARNAR